MNLPTRALVIGSGEDVPIEAPCISESTLVICADGGVNHAQKWGIIPHIVVGDLDSAEGNVEEWCQSVGAELIRFPVHKDKTDGELAVECALEKDIGHITMVGVWGSRIDHSLANLDLLYKLAEQGVKGEIITSAARMMTADGELSLNVKIGDTISLLPLSPKCEGVGTGGLYYPLDDAVLTKGTTLGISNKAVAENINIRCSDGVLLVVWQ